LRRRLALAAIVVAVAAAAAVLLLRESPEKAAQRALQEARALEGADPASLRRFAEALRALRERYPGTRVAGTADIALRRTERALAAFEELDRIRAGMREDLDEAAAGALRARLARLEEEAGEALLVRIATVRGEVEAKLVARKEAAFRDADAQAKALVAAKRFGDALAVWRAFETADYGYLRRSAEAAEAIEKSVLAEYRSLLRLAGGSDDLEARIGLLEANRPVFRGTRQAEDLEVRISALRARRREAQAVVAETPKPAETGPKPGQEPEEKGPYADPPKVADLVRARRYAEAASLLEASSRHPAAKVRIEELTLLAALWADLVASVAAKPAEFVDVALPEGEGRGDVVGADGRGVRVRRKDGAEKEYAWDAIPAKSFVRLFRQASLDKPPRLAAALFFDEELLPDDATRAWVAFFESEQAPTTLNRILARRRGIPEPPGGFQLFRGTLVTPAEKDAVVLRERIEAFAKQARSTDERKRGEAFAELEKLGGPATETLAAALRERRTAVADELRSSKAFSPGRFVARYGQELESRRKEALKFILDEGRYPYPNKTEEAQAEAERLVNLVRELYETPYPRLLEGSDQAKALDAELKALDERLARADPLAEPVYEQVVEAVTKGLDMRMVAIDNGDRKRIEYNIAVEKYNAELTTSADEEERANTRAVNEYRWMMGLHSVKIDERLLRAARKHSIEMQQLDYFAHDSPTPNLKTPAHRCRREGYGGGVSENIAMGAATGVQAFWQWFKSSGHHRNMVGGWTEMGCGSAAHHWWTQNFGGATGRSLDAPTVPPDPDPPGQSGNGRPALQ
jgi:uncharacterized protein YkwD